MNRTQRNNLSIDDQIASYDAVPFDLEEYFLVRKERELLEYWEKWTAHEPTPEECWAYEVMDDYCCEECSCAEQLSQAGYILDLRYHRIEAA